MNHRQQCPRHRGAAPPVSQLLEDAPGALSLELLTVGHAACHGTLGDYWSYVRFFKEHLARDPSLVGWLRDRSSLCMCRCFTTAGTGLAHGQ